MFKGKVEPTDISKYRLGFIPYREGTHAFGGEFFAAFALDVVFPFLIGKVLTVRVKAGSIDFQWTPVF